MDTKDIPTENIPKTKPKKFTNIVKASVAITLLANILGFFMAGINIPYDNVYGVGFVVGYVVAYFTGQLVVALTLGLPVYFIISRFTKKLSYYDYVAVLMSILAIVMLLSPDFAV